MTIKVYGITPENFGKALVYRDLGIFFHKYEEIRKRLRIWSYLLKNTQEYLKSVDFCEAC